MSTPLRAYLVDDEPLAIRRLTRMLEEAELAQVVGWCTDPIAALGELATADANVVFLDIQMPGLSGIEVAERLGALPRPPAIIFTTAFDAHALQAFEVNAADYLLKPIADRQLRRAVDKAARLSRANSDASVEQLRALLNTLGSVAVAKQPQEPLLERVGARVGNRIQFVELAQVTHLYAQDKLTYASTGDRTVVVDHTLTDLERRLDPNRWVRIHRSAIVNLEFVAELEGGYADATVRLKDGGQTRLEVARDRVRTLKDRLGV